MPTSRAFAYNPYETVPPGCTQYGNLAIEDTGWTVGAGGLKWYEGPDEDPGYVIAYPSLPPRTAASQSETTVGNSIGFRRTSTQSAVEFWALAEELTNQVFSGVQNARTYLLTNGYWTSYSGGPPDPGGDGIVLDGLTLRLDASNSSSYNGSGTTWFDISGTQENITLVNNPGWVSSSPNYFEFYGNEYGTGTQPVISSTQYTKSIWFQRTDANTDGNLVSSQAGGHFMYFGPDAENSNIHCGHTDWGNYLAFPSNTQILLDTWYCATLTFDTTNGMKLYINGVLDATYNSILTDVPGDLSTNIATFASTGGNTLTGKINKVYCYNRALTAAEVLQNYNADVIEFP